MTSAATRRTPSITEFGAERRYSAATMTRWQQLPEADARALLDLAAELRPSENQLRGLWEWATDIATRDAISLAQVLDHDTLRGARRRAHARSEKLKLVKNALRRLRFPQLTAAEASLGAHVRALHLPPAVRVEFPELLEGDDVRISFAARSTEDWAAIAHALLAAAANPRCTALFATLAEPMDASRAGNAPPESSNDAD